MNSLFKVLPVAALLVLSSCGKDSGQEIRSADNFSTDVQGEAKPWNSDTFDDTQSKFTFGIFTDLTGGERDGVFELAIEQLALLRPELILSVGDLIEGESVNKDSLAQEWDSFDARASKATAPVFYVGGNHDLTGMALREVWEDRLGKRFYHFVYKNVLFLALDTEDHSPDRMDEILEIRRAAVAMMGVDPDSARKMEYFHMEERETGDISEEQSKYFTDIIGKYQDVQWTYLFMHKPIWKHPDKPAFSAIEEALGARDYTVFSGHLHSYALTVKNGQDHITLGTTGGVQNGSDQMAFDHVTLVTVDEQGSSIANLRMDGILDKSGSPEKSIFSVCLIIF